MISVWLEPCDVVFFRDDLPFGAAGNQVARGQFPPRPSVIAGALRTKVLAAHGVDFDQFRTGEEIPPRIRAEIGSGRGASEEVTAGSFRLVRLALGRRLDGATSLTCHRVGRDLVGVGRPGVASRVPVRLVAPSREPRVPGVSSAGTLARLAVAMGYTPAGGWLGGRDYVAYLAGTGDIAAPVRDADILTQDYRVGIGLDPDTRTVDEGRLFSSQGVAMKPGWGMVAGVDGCSLLPDRGLLRLGGDGRMARIAPWTAPDPDWTSVREQVTASGRFRWILQTPAIFAKGWLPRAIEDTGDGLVLAGAAFRARLVTAALGAPELAGGWDLVRGRPKPVRRTVPAGSVYWFEVVEGDRAAPWSEYHERSVSDERAHEGFGLAHVGGWVYV